MRHSPLFAAAIVSSLLAFSASAQQAGSPNAGASDTSTIGYPTVAAALEALMARGDVEVSNYHGWTIIDDRASGALWSFTPHDHPAHPAAVKRTTVNEGGNVYMVMNALCQAEKPACDRLMAEFQELNNQIRDSYSGTPGANQDKWAPSERQKARAMEIVSRYLLAINDGRYRDAYDLLTSGLQSMMPFEDFEVAEQSFRAASGGDPVRSDTRVTWYNDPPHAAVPGVYAAFNIRCRFRNIDVCEEVLILHEQGNGEFLVMRQERNLGGRGIEQKNS